MNDRVVQEVRRHLEQEDARADGGGHTPGGLDGDAALLREGEERFDGLLDEERQVDLGSGERPLVGAAQQQQRLGEVDRSSIDDSKSFDEFVAVPIRIVAGDVEKDLRDRQRRAELVGGVGRESPLLGVVRFQPSEHGVEAVGELPELVIAALQVDPVGQRAAGDPARRVRDPGQGGEHPAGQNPSPEQTEHQQEHQSPGCRGNEGTHQVGPVGAARREGRSSLVHRNVAQEEHPHHREEQSSRDHQERGVAQSELQADARPGRPSHRPLPPDGVPHRSGSRRPAP